MKVVPNHLFYLYKFSLDFSNDPRYFLKPRIEVNVYENSGNSFPHAPSVSQLIPLSSPCRVRLSSTTQPLGPASDAHLAAAPRCALQRPPALTFKSPGCRTPPPPHPVPLSTFPFPHFEQCAAGLSSSTAAPFFALVPGSSARTPRSAFFLVRASTKLPSFICMLLNTSCRSLTEPAIPELRQHRPCRSLR
jgi:hypothetical protein